MRAQSFGLGQYDNIRLVSVTGWCCTLHSNTLCCLHTGPKPLPLLEAPLELPVCYPAPCLSLNLHNILVPWSQPHKPVSLSRYDLTDTVSVPLVWSAKFLHTQSVFIFGYPSLNAQRAHFYRSSGSNHERKSNKVD